MTHLAGPSRVRVGIVSWNTRDLLLRCLEALPDATAGLAPEVVVVDNASGDGSADAAAAAHPAVTVVRNPVNVGYARAMNQALVDGGEPGRYSALIALNPDTVPPAGSLTRLAEVLAARPDVGLVVPRLLNPDGTVQHSVYRFPSLPLALVVGLTPGRLHRGRVGRRWWLEGGSPHDRSGYVDWAIGAVHVIRPEAVEGRLPYCERWFMYVEDLDLCWRLARSGWGRYIEAGVEVVHVGNASGIQAWGDERVMRWLDATYDWYQLRRGRARTFSWAIANAAGVAAHRAGTELVARHLRAAVKAAGGARR